MSRRDSIPGFGKNAVDYGETDPDPPPHAHGGPWAVFQTYDPRRYTEEDRDRAAHVVRYLAMDPAAPRADLLAFGRRAIATVLTVRLLGEVLDDEELFLRILRSRPEADAGKTSRGHW